MVSQISRQLSPADRAIGHFDRILRTLSPTAIQARRPSPAEKSNAPDSLSRDEKQHAAGLMRVNHTGEVCAQALYQGQSLTAKLPEVRSEMDAAAEEESDHLAWCEQRLQALNGTTSKLNPAWYALSLGMGAGAGLISDKVSLGFVAATEDRVCQHLKSHLKKLPKSDKASRAVVEAMIRDEQRHGRSALAAGGYRFPLPVKWGMAAVAKVMTTLSYRI